ncbi:MAG: hypothetical protein ACFCUN_09755 [Hyphomicrobiaceae bacterium]
MTTNDTAAKIRPLRAVRSVAVLISAGVLASACSLDGNLLGPDATGTPAPLANQIAPVAPTPAARSMVALVAPVGAPANVQADMVTQLTQALQQRGIAVAPEGAPGAGHIVRGYIVAARERAGTKVSYIWDVNTPAGQRVNRIAGEEVISGANASDPWASITPQITSQIAEKTATSLAAWLPAQPSAAPAQVPLAAAPASSPSPAAPQVAGAPTPSQTTTGSIANPAETQSIVVVRPRVTGAPGDGNTALAEAISNELARGGVAMTNSPGPRTNGVNATVALGMPNNGKQPIEINWKVTAPDGRELGTVAQKNEIPAGSLDGAWGETAKVAAAAAAEGVLRLLRRDRQVAQR